VTGILKRFAGCFLAGLLAVLPAVLTIGIVIWVAGFVHRLVGSIYGTLKQLVFMPAESVQSIDMSVDGLMSIYVSMGITAPQFLSDRDKHSKTS